jgi:hypothetical protein
MKESIARFHSSNLGVSRVSSFTSRPCERNIEVRIVEEPKSRNLWDYGCQLVPHIRLRKKVNKACCIIRHDCLYKRRDIDCRRTQASFNDKLDQIGNQVPFGDIAWLCKRTKEL